MVIKHTESKTDEQAYFRIKEDHCKGFEEYRKEQDLEKFDELNLDWVRLMLKKKSAGPAVGQVSPNSLQMLFMATYDMDCFNRFLQSDNFRSIYNISDKEFKKITTDDIERLKFGYRLMFQVLFGEKTIEVKGQNVKKRSEDRKEIWQARHKSELDYARKNDPRYDPEVMGDEVMTTDSAEGSQSAECTQPAEGSPSAEGSQRK